MEDFVQEGSRTLLGLLSGLLIAYATGAWRKYGHRMERLYDLAGKLPEGSKVRDRFEAAAYQEAKNMTRRTLTAPPILVQLAHIFLALALLVGLLMLNPSLVYYLGRAIFLAQQGWEEGAGSPGPPWIGAVIVFAVVLVPVSVLIVVTDWLRNWGGRILDRWEGLDLDEDTPQVGRIRTGRLPYRQARRPATRVAGQRGPLRR